MKNYLFNIAVLIFSFLQTNAQTNKKVYTKPTFTSIVQAGILEGSADKTYGQFQLVNGIQKNAWFYGLGLGIDYYGAKRSLPLFFDVKRNMLKGKNTPFVYAAAGYNFSWLRKSEKINFWGNDYKTRGGLYYETGLGYKFTLKNKLAAGFSAGYSFKQQEEIFTPVIINEFPPFPQLAYKVQPEVYDFTFRRISLKFNCWF